MINGPSRDNAGRFTRVNDSPVVRKALEGLAIFNPATRQEARTLLSMYAHRDQLTDSDREAILNRYPVRGKGRHRAH